MDTAETTYPRIGAVALLALVPAFALGALLFLAPQAPITLWLFKPLLVSCGPLLPLSIVMALMGLGSPDRKRAALALLLFLPAIACTMAGASRAHHEAEARHKAASPAPRT